MKTPRAVKKAESPLTLEELTSAHAVAHTVFMDAIADAKAGEPMDHQDVRPRAIAARARLACAAARVAVVDAQITSPLLSRILATAGVSQADFVKLRVQAAEAAALAALLGRSR